MKNYVMNLAKRSGKTEDQPSNLGSGHSQGQGQNTRQRNYPTWKTTNVGATIARNDRTCKWCQWRGRHVISHDSSTCKETPSHPEYADYQKKKSEHNKKKEPELEMNLMEQNEDHIPINP